MKSPIRRIWTALHSTVSENIIFKTWISEAGMCDILEGTHVKNKKIRFLPQSPRSRMTPDA